MLLQRLQQYLAQEQRAGILQISQHMQVEVNVLRDMLQPFIRKGLIQRQTSTAHCGSSCHKCSSILTEVYCWCGH